MIKHAMLNQMSRRQPRTVEQLALDLRRERRGGRRPGAGRKPSPGRADMLRHVARPVLSGKHPVHVCTRTARGTGVPWLRSERIVAMVRTQIARASEKGFAVLHFSVQGTHLHLIVEADDATTLARGVQRLLSRIAMSLNAQLGRRGRVWRDRYFRQDITGPTQMRGALVYVLFNVRRHTAPSDGGLSRFDRRIDPMSSAAWLDGWHPRSRPRDGELEEAQSGPPVVARPRTWLARTGWRTRGGGPLRLDDDPRPIRDRRPRGSAAQA
ncbi:MAG: hypothetical protein JWP97_4347 [Labilithrix sp.]|nr:hypothetical protein [Labilithrix sp.]